MLRKDQMLKQLNAYSSTGFVLRISFDITISNIGMLVGMLLLYFTGIKMPRTMFVSGWFFILVLLFSSRLIRSYFYKTYKVVPLKTYDSQLNNIAKNLTTLAQQDGWMPPEGLPALRKWQPR